MSTMRRRALLRALGATGTLPFLRTFERSVLADELPLSFVTLYHPHGIAAEYWAQRTGETSTSFDLTYEDCSLLPFDDVATYGKSFKDKILIVEGLDLLSAANGHDSAGTILTGSRIVAQKPENVSLDQFLAIDRGLGAATLVSSVALAVGADDSASGVTLSYGPGGAPLPKIIDPVQAFDFLFTGVVVGDDPAAIAAAQREREKGQSIIDYVRADVTRLQARLPSEKRIKLDSHLDGLRELEKQLGTTIDGSVCTVPATPDATQFPAIKQYNGGEPYFDVITDLKLDLLAHAIACGITRFATMLMNDLSYAGNPLGLPADNHGAVAHTYDASSIGKNGTPGEGNPSSWLPLAQINRYSFSKVARFMKRLDDLGALDSTLIYVTSDMGNPALHSTRNVPTLLAGGANGKLQMGRRIKLAPDCPPDNVWCGESDPVFAGVPTNRLLVSIAQMFDVPIDAFGTQSDPADTEGALTEIV